MIQKHDVTSIKKEGNRVEQESISTLLNSGPSPLPSLRWLKAAPSHHNGASSIRLELVKSQLPTITCALFYSYPQMTSPMFNMKRRWNYQKHSFETSTLDAVLNHPPVTLDRERNAKIQHWPVLQGNRAIKCKYRIKEIFTNWT